MTEREKQTTFLKKLLRQRICEYAKLLEDRIIEAEQNEKCVSKAMRLVVLLGVVSMTGLCYEAVFVDDFFTNPGHLLTRLFGYLFFASAVCTLGFVVYWLWYRALSNRLYEECRRLVMSEPETHSGRAQPADRPDAQNVCVINQDSPSQGPTIAKAA